MPLVIAYIYVYIYIYSYVYYIFIYVTFVDPCTCGNEQGKTKQNQLRTVRDKNTQKRVQQPRHTGTRARTHTHTRKQSQVFDTQVESYSQKSRGKWKGWCAREGARVALSAGSG